MAENEQIALQQPQPIQNQVRPIQPISNGPRPIQPISNTNQNTNGPRPIIPISNTNRNQNQPQPIQNQVRPIQPISNTNRPQPINGPQPINRPQPLQNTNRNQVLPPLNGTPQPINRPRTIQPIQPVRPLQPLQTINGNQPQPIQTAQNTNRNQVLPPLNGVPQPAQPPIDERRLQQIMQALIPMNESRPTQQIQPIQNTQNPETINNPVREFVEIQPIIPMQIPTSPRNINPTRPPPLNPARPLPIIPIQPVREDLGEAIRPIPQENGGPEHGVIFGIPATDQRIDPNPTPINFDDMKPFTDKAGKYSNLHISPYRSELNNIRAGQYLTTYQDYKQIYEIYNYRNLPSSYLGIIDNIIRCLHTDSRFLSLMIDEEYGFQRVFNYESNPVLYYRAATTNHKNLNEYYEALGNLNDGNLDNFFRTSTIGKQLNNAMVFNKALYDNLMLKSEQPINETQIKAVITLLDNNIRSGFNFLNDIDCLFNNTYGILTALYHKTDLNENKRPKNPNVIEDFKTKVLLPFQRIQNHVNSNLDKYYKELILTRNNVGYRDANEGKLRALQDFLRLNAREFTNVMFEEGLNAFINNNLNVDPNVRRNYNGNITSIRDYYINRIRRQLGDDFATDYNNAKQSINQSITDFLNKYDVSITNFIDKFYNDNDEYKEDIINFKNKTYEYMKDLASQGNNLINDFIESALDYIEDNIASLSFDNFIFNHMAYRTTCLLLMYYFMPSNAIGDDLVVSDAIWTGEWYKADEIKSDLSASFEDGPLYETDSESDNSILKNSMVYNEVFTMIAMKILPKLNAVNNVGYGDFNDGITQDVQSVLYIIRPSGHDHTFCVAKHGDKFFFSDDIHIRGTLLRAINNPVGLDTNQGFNFVYEDMYDNLTGGKTHYNFIGYRNDNKKYFVNYINSSSYKNVICCGGVDVEKFIEIFYVVMPDSDFSDTMTKQIYALPQRGGANMFENIFKGILILVIIAVVIGLIVIIVKSVTKKNKKQNENQSEKQSEKQSNESTKG